MKIARSSIERQIITWLIILGCLFGGIAGFFALGRLEDPAFTIKTAVVWTQYPGATAEEVSREVSDPLESEIQKMGEIKNIRTINQPGFSLIKVDMKDQYDGKDLPQIWTKLRNRVAGANLPAGTSVPFVDDKFGDVFGIYYAVTAPGYSEAEIYELSNFLRLELLAVKGVADVAVSGVPDEIVLVEPNMAVTVNQGVPPSVVQQAIANANNVVDSGSLQSVEGRTLIQRPVGNDSVEDIAGLTVGVAGKLLYIYNFADVSRAREPNPNLIIRHNGQEAFTLGVAGLSTENIVHVGERVDEKLKEIKPLLPLGVELNPIYQQHTVVEEASNNFLVNLAMSVSIVIIVLALFMGWRAAVVVGVTLFLTVVGTLLFMWGFAISMERISLGALIIAMGMLVDNAIVVAEGMQFSMKRGMSSTDAAEDAAGKTQIPLLGATVIGILAFAGIGLSADATGEFLFSLFAVIGISLMLSWILAITVTPLLGHYFFQRGSGEDGAAYDGAMFRAYGSILRFCIRIRWIVLAGLVALTATNIALFGSIKQQFFPDSNTPLFYVHYKLPQGASIHETSRDLGILESWLDEQESVTAYTTYVGGGASRFLLTYEAEDLNPSYGHIIVRTENLDVIAPLIAQMKGYAANAVPGGEFRAKRLAFGPGGNTPIEARFSGRDPEVLRELGDEAIRRMTEASDKVLLPRLDWREMEQVLRPVYATERAQAAGVTRDDLAFTMKFATEGIDAGVFREGNRQIPIRLRANPDDDLALMDQVVYSSTGDVAIQFEQVTDGLEFEPQNTLLMRRNRLPTITVGADIPIGNTAAEVQAEIMEAIEQMPLPPGYIMEWGGEHESSGDAQESLARQLPLSLILMILISVLLFQALRQPLIIWLIVPMAINGVTLSLLGAGLPFTFTALLGLLSLTGMLIKNGIVLVEEIDIVRRESPELDLQNAIISASTSRIRPVVLAAATTILGMIPLVPDAFFQSMAVTIMGGLAFASVLTLIAAPVLYYVFFIGDERKRSAPAAAAGLA